MNFRRTGGRGRALATIDITALVDVVFLLLIFLLVTTTFRRDEHAFVIDLVSSSGEQIHVTSDKTTVYIDQKGEFYLLAVDSDQPVAEGQGEPVSAEELKGRLKEIQAANPGAGIAIRGAKTATYQRLVDVVNLIDQVGFRDVSFAYEKDEE